MLLLHRSDVHSIYFDILTLKFLNISDDYFQIYDFRWKFTIYCIGHESIDERKPSNAFCMRWERGSKFGPVCNSINRRFLKFPRCSSRRKSVFSIVFIAVKLKCDDNHILNVPQFRLCNCDIDDTKYYYYFAKWMRKMIWYLIRNMVHAKLIFRSFLRLFWLKHSPGKSKTKDKCIVSAKNGARICVHFKHLCSAPKINVNIYLYIYFFIQLRHIEIFER